MDSHRARHTAFWIAVLAILWGLLLPTLASSAHSAPGKTWVDACLSGGATQVRLDLPDAGAVRKDDTASGAPDLPRQADVLAPAAAARIPAPAARAIHPALYPADLTPPHPQAARSAHPTRAPPRHA